MPGDCREDFEASDLRRLATSKDAGQSRRLVALAEIYDGGRRTDAARISGFRSSAIGSCASIRKGLAA